MHISVHSPWLPGYAQIHTFILVSQMVCELQRSWPYILFFILIRFSVLSSPFCLEQAKNPHCYLESLHWDLVLNLMKENEMSTLATHTHGHVIHNVSVDLS